MVGIYIPVLIFREEVTESFKVSLVFLGHVSPCLSQPEDGAALEAGHHCLHTMDVVQLVQFLRGERIICEVYIWETEICKICIIKKTSSLLLRLVGHQKW